MKIGILTYNLSENYGAVLQAYALKTFLTSKGYDAEFVDYVHPAHREMYSLYSKKRLEKKNFIGKIKYNISFILKFSRLYKRKKKFKDFINNYLLPTSDQKQSESEYDIVFYGSDQIWRKQTAIGLDDFNEVYFGSEHIKAKRKVSYAASMGILHSSDKDKAKLTELLKNFDSISVREQDLYELIQPLTEKKVEIVLDPVFLLTKSDWQQIIGEKKVKRKYILLYNLLHNDDAVLCAKQIAKKENLELIEINGKIDSTLCYRRKRYNSCGPLDFLSLIYHAEFVVSTSFHGVAFAILFNKQFFSFLKEHSERIVSILNRFELSDRFYPDKEQIKIVEAINYDLVNGLLNQKREFSISFINENLK